jgi:coenzyme F420-reducing hydrogenase beta subunit
LRRRRNVRRSNGVKAGTVIVGEHKKIDPMGVSISKETVMASVVKELCTGCSACYSICPQNCIRMNPDNEGFLYPEIDTEKCIHCNACAEICPVLKQRNETTGNAYPLAYAVINNDEVIRNKSTSGGIFSLLAAEIINQKGMVFGVKFDNDFTVIHGSTNTMDGIGVFRGSKYVQSRIGETFKECKDNLDKGIKVLFSGTPCQIGGLKAYLQKEYDTLWCIDLICMSVPSPRVWKKYVEYRTKMSGSTPKKIAFRYKNPQWKSSSMYFEFENKSVYTAAGGKDPFLRIFGSDICARHACMRCNFRTLNRQSDITIADFWGIEHIYPEMDDNKGTSLVLVNSKSGEELFKRINGNCSMKAVAVEEAVKYNPRAVESRIIQKKKMNKKREKLFKYLDILPFDKLLKKCFYDSIILRGYRFLRRCIGKIKRKELFAYCKKYFESL